MIRSFTMAPLHLKESQPRLRMNWLEDRQATAMKWQTCVARFKGVYQFYPSRSKLINLTVGVENQTPQHFCRCLRMGSQYLCLPGLHFSGGYADHCRQRMCLATGAAPWFDGLIMIPYGGFPKMVGAKIIRNWQCLNGETRSMSTRSTHHNSKMG